MHFGRALVADVADGHLAALAGLAREVSDGGADVQLEPDDEEPQQDPRHRSYQELHRSDPCQGVDDPRLTANLADSGPHLPGNALDVLPQRYLRRDEPAVGRDAPCDDCAHAERHRSQRTGAGAAEEPSHDRSGRLPGHVGDASPGGGDGVGHQEIVVADEPLVSVDPARSAEIIELFARAFAGRTLIVSTHRLDPLLPLVSRVIGLRSGVLVFDMPSAALTLVIFSAIPYKTPWNLLPFYVSTIVAAGIGVGAVAGANSLGLVGTDQLSPAQIAVLRGEEMARQAESQYRAQLVRVYEQRAQDMVEFYSHQHQARIDWIQEQRAQDMVEYHSRAWEAQSGS